MIYPIHYDVLVVGGGHAGIEAALAAARCGCRTLLITHNIETLGQLSCNPSIGGIGKGHLVREVDAMGGLMARAADIGGIQFRTLNASKGPAVRATRAQVDRSLYKAVVRQTLENQRNLDLFQQEVDGLELNGNRVIGVHATIDLMFRATTVILTAGTFLAGKIYVGLDSYRGGRAGDSASLPLSEQLREIQLPAGRLKTGTPPRIDGRTIDFSVLTEQPGDSPEPYFSFMSAGDEHPVQCSCWVTHTNLRTHEIIRSGLDRSPMFTGMIEGVGPRYCPSIEDKIHRFAGRDSHQIFLEPEGLNTIEYYPNGISTSLPFDIQVKLVQSMLGLENAYIMRPGYAIEYDYFDPRGLKSSLESKNIEGLFFAGQINGTTGYEEAAAQGLLAGLNAVLNVRGQPAWCPGRDQAYLGVMVDDLITRGVTEPYRMFTSRAEYRLQLREDNADLRLTEIARNFGLISDELWKRFCEKREAIEQEKQRLIHTWLQPSMLTKEQAIGMFGKPLEREYCFSDLLKRPDIDYQKLMSLPSAGEVCVERVVWEQVEIQIKYQGYIDRQLDEIMRHQSQEEMKLPLDIDYTLVKGLSREVQQKLNMYRPETLGQAARISGITPAAVALLLVYLKRGISHIKTEHTHD